MTWTRISKLLGQINILLIICFCSLSVQAKYGGGSGTPEDPYLIYDANHMQAIGTDSNDWDKCFKLMADIDLGGYTGTGFNIIGNDVIAFTGVFDGNRKTISNFTWNSANDYRISMFGYLGSDGVIRNLELENVDVNVVGGYMIAGLVAENNGEISGCSLEGIVSGSESWVGGLVASNRGTISDCHVRGSVSSVGAERGDRVGGLVGESYSGSEINGCSSECIVVGDWGLVGGLVGENWSVMSDCSSSGTVAGLGDYSDWIGGLVGKNVRPIINCYSTSSVSGHDGIGGLVGCTYSQIIDSYSSGNVSGYDRVGGLVGRHQNSLISMCYSRGYVSGNSEVGGLIGYHSSVADAAYLKCFLDGDINPDVNGIGNAIDPNVVSKTTAEMKQQVTFTYWDFINVWNIGENQTYPYLRRYLAGDINKDGIVNFFDLAIEADQWLEEYYLGNRPPRVLITYPEDGARLMVGGVPPQTMILADAEDSDGTVVRVEFFVDDLKLGEDTDGSDGWSYLWQNYSLGFHVLTATAWDNEGLSGISTPVNVEVWMPDPPPP